MTLFTPQETAASPCADIKLPKRETSNPFALAALSKPARTSRSFRRNTKGFQITGKDFVSSAWLTQISPFCCWLLYEYSCSRHRVFVRVLRVYALGGWTRTYGTSSLWSRVLGRKARKQCLLQHRYGKRGRILGCFRFLRAPNTV